MNRKEYTDRVTACLKGVAWSDRQAIRAELDAHIEDHICDLLALGYDEQLAEERTMAHMGDPEEVGRALKKQYPLRWRVLPWLTAPLFLMMLVYLLLFAPDDEMSFTNGNYERFTPRLHVEHTIEAERREDVDIRFNLGDDQVRVLQIAVGEGCASVYADIYHRIPFGPAGTAELVLENQRGERGEPAKLVLTRWWKHGCAGVSIAPEDTYVVLCCDRFGADVRLRIPLPGEVLS